ncbi:MAG: hypoxanthine phosphoribosyltransferase [Halobacteriovorax sp.]|nr:hypoxanthine phosphoribosyltransferase [Halobacteriovorax sp.]|tara:strand:- start:75498 stop:76019 length:522 start_codon:yes stop_codon:yes gene_type:complete
MAIKEYLSEEKIKQRVAELGAEISKDYAGEEVVVVGVLNGSFIFMADLVRQMDLPVKMEFIGASSYGDATISSGNVKIHLDLRKDISNQHVLLVEDIVDTGNTIKALQELLSTRKAKSVKVCSFLFKPARLEQDVKIDYLAFEIEDHFVIGYGLDYAGRYRELPYVGIWSEDK